MGFADANQYLASKGVPSSKFETVGTEVIGTLVDADSMHATDTNGVLQYMKDGVTPKMQLVLTWDSNERDSAIPGDTGRRKLYCGWRMESALKAAMKAAGGQGLEEGAVVGVTFTGEEKVKGSAFKAKLYDVRYELPSKKLGSSKAAPAAPAKENPSDASIKTAIALNAAGTDINVIAQATGISVDYLTGEVFGI